MLPPPFLLKRIRNTMATAQNSWTPRAQNNRQDAIHLFPSTPLQIAQKKREREEVVDSSTECNLYHAFISVHSPNLPIKYIAVNKKLSPNAPNNVVNPCGRRFYIYVRY